MKPALTLVPLLLIVPVLSFAQDVELRREAVRLMERASAVSLNPNTPNLERRVTFRVLDPGAKVQDGAFTRTVIQGVGRREETTFGDYHAIDIYTNMQLATVGSGGMVPPEVDTVMRLTPVNLVTFGGEDVIRAIRDKEAEGRKLRCIAFDTIIGLRSEANELCLDSANGTLATEKIGEEFIENSDFFSFAGSLLPAKIRYSYAGVPRLEISQTMTLWTGPTGNVLAVPPGARISVECTTSRRAIGEIMPQPEPGHGTGNFDVVIRGIIERDGMIHDAVVQSSPRPDLNAEALRLIQQWKFTPEMCNGQPNPSERSFVLHFQAR
jgi:TonB family protein